MSIGFNLKDCCYDCKWFSPRVHKNIKYSDDGKAITDIEMTINCDIEMTINCDIEMTINCDIEDDN